MRELLRRILGRNVGRSFGVAAVVAALMAFAPSAFAQDRGSRDEAQAMAEKAMAHIQKVGKDQAITDFENLENKEFHDRDLYVVMVAFDGKTLAHGTNKKLKDLDTFGLKDVNGKLFIQDEIRVAKEQGRGWTDFVWNDPLTKKIRPKSIYVIGAEGYLVGVGVYTD